MEEKAKKRNKRVGLSRKHTSYTEVTDTSGNTSTKSPTDSFVHIFKGCGICSILPHAICITDRDLQILVANPYMESLLTYSRGDLDGKNLINLINENGQKAFSEYLESLSISKGRMHEAELVRKDKSRIWVNTATTPLDEGGNLQGYLFSFTEITDYKRIIDELQLSSKLLDTASDYIYLRDLDGNMIYANQSACRAHGFSKEEMLKININRIVAPEYQDILTDKIKELHKKGEITFELEHLTKDGNKFPAEEHWSLVESGNKRLILSVVHDLRRHKKMEDELHRVLKMESVALIAGGIASRFNSMLTHIAGNINIVLNEADVSAQLRKLLEETEKNTERARDLARRLLAFSKSGAAVRKVISVAELLKDTADYILSSSNLFCNFFISEGLHKVEVDEGQFSQALSNLLINASQAMPKGGVIDISADNVSLEDGEISDLPKGEYVRISIRDRGHGIDPADLPHIFDPYFTTKEERLGLGLSIVYTIIRNHRGAITADSQPGEGSTFNIYLPAVIEGEKKEIRQAQENIRYGVKMLIVDDEAVIRSAGGRLLRRLGYEQIEFATSSNEALQKFKQAFENGSPYQVVILDLSIPGGPSGKEVIKNLLKLDPNISILVSSGYFDGPALRELYRYGIKGVLAKPFKLEELKLLLQEEREEKPE